MDTESNPVRAIANGVVTGLLLCVPWLLYKAAGGKGGGGGRGPKPTPQLPPTPDAGAEAPALEVPDFVPDVCFEVREDDDTPAALS